MQIHRGFPTVMRLCTHCGRDKESLWVCVAAHPRLCIGFGKSRHLSKPQAIYLLPGRPPSAFILKQICFGGAGKLWAQDLFTNSYVKMPPISGKFKFLFSEHVFITYLLPLLGTVRSPQTSSVRPNSFPNDPSQNKNAPGKKILAAELQFRRAALLEFYHTPLNLRRSWPIKSPFGSNVSLSRVWFMNQQLGHPLGAVTNS